MWRILRQAYYTCILYILSLYLPDEEMLRLEVELHLKKLLQQDKVWEVNALISEINQTFSTNITLWDIQRLVSGMGEPSSDLYLYLLTKDLLSKRSLDHLVAVILTNKQSCYEQ